MTSQETGARPPCAVVPREVLQRLGIPDVDEPTDGFGSELVLVLLELDQTLVYCYNGASQLRPGARELVQALLGNPKVLLRHHRL